MMTMADSIGDVLTPDEIRAAVERMIGSDVFSRSPQLGAFLRFVVDAVLRGKADRIKAYTIGVEVLRRDPKFDPQLDPIVRVEATRLRRAIERYYASAGLSDPVIIDLPRGSYVPTFRRREAAGAAPVRSRRWLALLSGRPRIAIGLGGAALVLIAVLAAVVLRTGSSPPAAGSATFSPMMGTPRAGNGMPVLYVQRLERHGTAPELPAIEAAVFDAMQNAFPRFDTINMVFEPKEEARRAVGRNKGIDYWLSGSIDVRDGQKVANFQLRDDGSNEVVWAGTFKRTATAPDYGPIEGQIVDELATTLFQSFGVIRSHQRRQHLAGPAGDPRYRCIVATSESLRSFDPADHALARNCLEPLTATHPDFDSGFAYLAAIYYREDQYGFDMRPGDAPASDRALRAARHAVELKPEGARAYQMLATVLFGRREIAESFAGSRKAMALNPSDMTIVSDFGGRLILTGDIERGMGMLRRAAAFGAVRPSWYHFYVFLGSYMLGDFAAAAFEADQITVAGYQLGYLARALSSASRGNGERARAEIERLTALRPAWRTDPRRELARFIPNPDMVERLARDLAAAGLAGGG